MVSSVNQSVLAGWPHKKKLPTIRACEPTEPDEFICSQTPTQYMTRRRKYHYKCCQNSWRATRKVYQPVVRKFAGVSETTIACFLSIKHLRIAPTQQNRVHFFIIAYLQYLFFCHPSDFVVLANSTSRFIRKNSVSKA